MGSRSVCGVCHIWVAPPREVRHWDLSWSSLYGHETYEGCARRGRRRRGRCATGTLAGAPYKAAAAKRVRGVPNWGGAAMRAAPL
eukprot:4300260-Pyramimonas_sp.AAC.1